MKYTSPPSPGGSTKGLYVRSRPTSIDGSVMDAPFASFSLAPTIIPLPTPSAANPKTKQKVYAHSTKSMYLGTVASSALSVRTNRTAVVPVRAVRRGPAFYDSAQGQAQVGAGTASRRATWLRKIVPGVFKRTKTKRSDGDGDVLSVDGDEAAPLVPGLRPKNSSMTLRSRKSGKSAVKAAGIENRPPADSVRAQRVRRSRSFSGYVYAHGEDEDELDGADDMPEVREAMRINAGIHATGYRYERLDAAQTRDLEEFMEREYADPW